MEVTSLCYQPKLGGRAHGTMMLHLELGGEGSPPSSYEVMELVDRCETASKMMGSKIKNVMVFPKGFIDEEETQKFLMMLIDRGFVVGLGLDGKSIPLYLKYAHFIQAKIDEVNWVNFKVDELIYVPDEGMNHPNIHEINIPCMKYLFFEGKDPTKFITFIKESPLVWGLLVPPRKSVSVDFLKGK